jgi:mono/diheme cytochrome c family protein
MLSARGATGEKVDFNYDIRPIISANCYHCHGPDEESRKAKLRLDLREEAIKDRDGFTAIVPGNPEASELLLRVVSTDPDEVMPPPKEGHALTEQEVELLRRWIAQGAEYKPHWSFSKPQRPEVPASADGKPFRHPIDAFIGSRLSSEGLKLSPEADRHTLIRRASLDLIGLPPTREEIQAFVADESADAYQKVVDRLLASPAYGERWAKMWLDLARFADSTGYGSDKFRLNIWPYRDWVIDAFNRNVPYDQFTTEQLAGDLLPSASREQIAATAFHRNTMTNVEGGTIDEEYRVAAVKDRIATTSQVWMGLTMQCAQCHTHKFDPISHEEYYQFFAIFNQTEDSDREDEEPKLPLPTREEQAKMDSLKQEIATLEKQSAQQTPELALEQRAWEAEMLRPIDWTPLQPSK